MSRLQRRSYPNYWNEWLAARKSSSRKRAGQSGVTLAGRANVGVEDALLKGDGRLDGEPVAIAGERAG